MCESFLGQGTQWLTISTSLLISPAASRRWARTRVDMFSQYYGSIAMGTPPIQYEVILDSGSSDLLLATAPCSGCETTTPLYNEAKSTSSIATTKPFSITYGTGAASGTLAQDVMSMAGYTIKQQVRLIVCATRHIRLP